MVVHAYNLSYKGGIGRRILVLIQSKQKAQNPILKTPKAQNS